MAKPPLSVTLGQIQPCFLSVSFLGPRLDVLLSSGGGGGGGLARSEGNPSGSRSKLLEVEPAKQASTQAVGLTQRSLTITREAGQAEARAGNEHILEGQPSISSRAGRFQEQSYSPACQQQFRLPWTGAAGGQSQRDQESLKQLLGLESQRAVASLMINCGWSVFGFPFGMGWSRQ